MPNRSRASIAEQPAGPAQQPVIPGAFRHSSPCGINLQAVQHRSLRLSPHVIAKIVNGHPNSRIDDLLPWAYRGEPELKAVA